MSQSLDSLVGSFFSTTGGRGNYRVLLKRLWRLYQQVIIYIQLLDSASPGIQKIGKWKGIDSIVKTYKGILGAINRVPKIPNRVNKQFMQNLLDFAGAGQFTTAVNNLLSDLVLENLPKLVKRLKLKCCKSELHTAPCKEKWLQLIARLKEYAPRIIGPNGAVHVDMDTPGTKQNKEVSTSPLPESESAPCRTGVDGAVPVNMDTSGTEQNEEDSTSLLPESESAPYIIGLNEAVPVNMDTYPTEFEQNDEDFTSLLMKSKYVPCIIGLNEAVPVNMDTYPTEFEQNEEDLTSFLSESESAPCIIVLNGAVPDMDTYRTEFGQNEEDSTSLLPESKVTETEPFDSMMETIEGQLCIAESFLDYLMTEEKETGDRNNHH